MLLLVSLVLIILRTAEGFNNYRGVGRWDSKIYKPWIGSNIYPVSSNCNCPDNHIFIDNSCVNRDYPNKVSKPFCYDNLE
jgi:hypothetical protein